MSELSACLFADLLGKPFEQGGRGPAAFDCVGLAAEVQRRRGLVLPAYLSDPEELHRQLAEGGILNPLHKILEAEPGCVALVRMLDGQRHIGTMLDGYRMLHTTRQTGGVVIDRVLSPLWTRRILGFYRMEAR